MLSEETNEVYGNYDNGPEYNIAVDNNYHYSNDDTPNWEGAMVTDNNQHYEWKSCQRHNRSMGDTKTGVTLLVTNLALVKKSSRSCPMHYIEIYQFISVHDH